MTDGNSQNLERRPNDCAAGGLRVVQFSLVGLFVITTGIALVLSIYISVGRWVGMSTIEVLTIGIGPLLVPTLLVWIIGLTMAIRLLKRNRFVATLAIIAFGGLMLTSIVHGVVHMALIHSWFTSGNSSIEFMRTSQVILITYALVNTVWWILILISIFARRPPAVQQSGPSEARGDPFLKDK